MGRKKSRLTMLNLVRCALFVGLMASSYQAPVASPASRAVHESTSAAKPTRLEGMPYWRARAIILRFGWHPFKGDCGGPAIDDTLCSQFPEISYCSGSGVGYCGMLFYRQDRCLILITVGGTPETSGRAGAVVRDVTFHRRPCLTQ